MRSLAHAGYSVLQSRPNRPTDKTNKRQTKRAPFPLRDLLQAPRNRDTLSFGGTGISFQYVQGSSHAKNQLDSFSRFDSTPTCGRQTRTQDHSIFGTGIASHDKKWKLRVETFMYVTPWWLLSLLRSLTLYIFAYRSGSYLICQRADCKQKV